jgi:SAM-dependent methyltransferase
LTSSAAPTPDHILQTGLAFWPSKTLLSAVEMGVFTELAQHGPQHFDELSGRLGLHPRGARDFLDTLVALKFLQRTGDVYSNTRETDLFLDRHKPSYIGGILEMANTRLYHFWGHLTEALRTGRQQNEARDGSEPTFAALYADPARLKSFLAAMSGISHGANMAIAKQVPWSNYKTYADVGTAQGDLAVQIALANPHLQGIGYDLAECAPIFEEYVHTHNLDGRVRFQPGDFFTQSLPNVDVITMGHILHDWNLDEKKMLIRKAYDALNPGGAFVAYDAVIDDDRSQNAFGLMMSLNMLIETPGGFDYSGADCIGWMKEAGFREAHVEHLVGPDSMVIAFK